MGLSPGDGMKGAVGVRGIAGVPAGTAPSAAPIALSLRAIGAGLLSSILFYFIFQIQDGRL